MHNELETERTEKVSIIPREHDSDILFMAGGSTLLY